MMDYNTNKANNKDYGFKKSNNKRRMKKIVQSREYDIGNIDSITIDSPIAGVSIVKSSKKNLEVSLEGISTYDGEIYIDFINKSSSELEIKVVHTGSYQSSNLMFNVAIPQKEYESIVVKTNLNGISITDDITTHDLNFSSQTGDLDSSALFDNMYLSTQHGDINITVAKKDNLYIHLNTISGNIKANLSNIGYIALSAKSKLGKVNNLHEQNYNADYSAIVDISTIGGNITIL